MTQERSLLKAMILVALVHLACSASPPEHSHAVSPPGNPVSTAKAHALFSATDLGLLESDDRDNWQRTDEIFDDLKIADGFVVADIAAAGGWFAARISRRVGPSGLVYAEDIQPTMIQAIARRMQVEGLLNITPVLGTPDNPHLPADALNCAVIINSFHDIEDPVPLLENIRRALKADGLLGIVDFTPGGGGPGPDAADRVSPERIIAAASAANLRLVTERPLPPFEFLLVFEK